jgi:vacuolar protein sorting-associated protein 72
LQEENDINYEAEPEVADEFDSDFDEDVSFPYTSQHFYM